MTRSSAAIAQENVIGLAGPDDEPKRRQILDGARSVFLESGFDGASMSEIARAAGVSKGTLYVYFADKNRLFEAIVEQETLAARDSAFTFDPARAVEPTLHDFGRAYIGVLCRPGGGSATRTVMAIAERMPDVGKRFYVNVLQTTIDRLADYLTVRAQAGDLAIADVQLAAAQFMQACQATLFQPYIFQAEPAPSADRIAAVVDSAVTMFLKTYGR